MNEKLLQRYLKIKALADGGEGGEKKSARLILTRMEQDHPGIARAAATYLAAQAPPPPPPPPPGQAPRRGGLSGNWENIFRYASGVYQTVTEVVDDVTDALYGKTLAEEGVEFRAGSRREYISIRVNIPYETLEAARNLNHRQKEAFRQAMHTEFDAYVLSILSDPDEGE